MPPVWGAEGGLATLLTALPLPPHCNIHPGVSHGSIYHRLYHQTLWVGTAPSLFGQMSRAGERCGGEAWRVRAGLRLAELAAQRDPCHDHVMGAEEAPRAGVLELRQLSVEGKQGASCRVQSGEERKCGDSGRGNSPSKGLEVRDDTCEGHESTSEGQMFSLAASTTGCGFLLLRPPKTPMIKS